VVFLTGLEDGIFRTSAASGIPTSSRRAAPLLRGHHASDGAAVLCHAWSRTLFGATDYYPPSRFLNEIPRSSCTRSVSGANVAGAASTATRSSTPRSAPGRSRRGDLGRDRPAAPSLGARGAESAGLKIGDDVEHEIFVRRHHRHGGAGDSVEAVVRFRDVGEKRLLLQWAPLKKLG